VHDADSVGKSCLMIFIASGLEAMNIFLYYDVTNCIISKAVEDSTYYEIQLSWELFDQ
jgi:hypothetical protein